MLALLLSAGGVLGAAYLQQQKEKNAALASPAGALTAPKGSAGQPLPNHSASPATSYPFQVPQAPRMDNKNQPWTQNNPGQAIQTAGQLTSGLADLWTSLGIGDSTAESGLGSDLAASSQDVQMASNDEANYGDAGWQDDFGFNYDTGVGDFSDVGADVSSMA